MRRFFIDKIEPEDGLLSITGAEANHIIRVVRMDVGDRIILMNTGGARFQAIIKSIKPREVEVFLEKSLPTPPPSPVEIILCQALLKARAMDYLIQKTSELGVNHIFPFSSSRTVISLDGNRIENKLRHWREIAKSAVKQSDRGIPVKISQGLTFRDMTARWKQEDVLKIILWEEEGAQDLKEVLKASSSYLKKFIGIVGPEGGFNGAEIAAAGEAGFIPVSLGKRVLRAETAAITMVAIVQYERGDLGLP